MPRSLVFGIGFNKTGTSSLHQALKMLGWSSFHNEFAMQAEIDKNLGSARPLFGPLTQKYRAFSDDPVWEHFRRLDHDYPGSKFIHTTRPFKDWVTSRERHWSQDPGTRKRRETGRKPWERNHEKLQATWVAHNHMVRAWFRNRPRNLLIFRVCAGEGWKELCFFLGVPIRKDLFPWMMPSHKHPRRLEFYDAKTGLQK